MDVQKQNYNLSKDSNEFGENSLSSPSKNSTSLSFNASIKYTYLSIFI